MSYSPGGRESPSSTASSTTASGSGSVIGSVGSGSNGCRNSGASFDSGRATSTTFQGVRYSAGGLSSESSLGSFRHSYHSSSSSLGSIPSEEIRNFDVAAMISQGVPDHEILNAWLTGIHLECYYQNFIQAGYDMHTISRMTPEDLNAIGVTKPHHRKKIKSEISQLNISEGLPDYIPESIDEWLRLLRLDDYLHKLKEQGYQNVRQVTNITWEDLEDIGILKLGHQKKFMLAIKRVQDILSGKRVPSSYVPNAYLTPMENFPQSQQQPLRHAPSMPYNHPNISVQAIGSHFVSNQQHHQYHPTGTIYPHHIQRNIWPQTQIYQNTIPQSTGISHQIQIHSPPTHERMPPGCIPHPGHQMVQPLYHPEVISIRVKNGHGNKSLDSPPEEEPIYGTSSFLPNQAGTTNSPWQQQKGNQPFKSYEEGETTPTNGYGNSNIISNGSNLAMTKQTMSNTWTLPRLQKHKPISKVMGGGTNSNSCDSSVTYPINPGPFAPQQLNPPPGPAPSVTTFGKGSDYGTVKNGPPPPPRRSSCATLGGQSQQLDEDNIPLPPPPPLSEDSMGTGSPVSLQSANSNCKSNFTYVNESYKAYGMSASYYGQRSTNLNSYQNPPDTGVPNGNGTGGGFRSTLPMTKSRDPSPVGSEFSSDADLLSNSGLLSKGVKRNGSDASFKSNSSTESESIPFANDNAGTIKQQKPGANRTAQQSGGVAGVVSETSTTVNSTGVDGTVETGDVLSNIGSMLSELSDQLDAILEQERTSKR